MAKKRIMTWKRFLESRPRTVPISRGLAVDIENACDRYFRATKAQPSQANISNIFAQKTKVFISEADLLFDKEDAEHLVNLIYHRMKRLYG